MKALLLAVGLAACAPKKPAAQVQPAPPWATAGGREKTKMDLAKMLLNQGNPDAALTLVTQLRDAGSAGPELDLLQAEALIAKGMVDDASALLLHVPRRDPSWAEARNQLGLMAMDKKDVAGAVKDFGDAVKANAKSPSYWNNLGFALMSAHRASDAVLALRHSIALDSAQPRTRNNLGFALLAAGQEDEALREFKAQGSDADARYNLGLGYELAGDKARALQNYSAALQSDPDHAAAREGLERLAAPPVGGAATEPPAPVESL